MSSWLISCLCSKKALKYFAFKQATYHIYFFPVNFQNLKHKKFDAFQTNEIYHYARIIAIIWKG